MSGLNNNGSDTRVNQPRPECAPRVISEDSQNQLRHLLDSEGCFRDDSYDVQLSGISNATVVSAVRNFRDWCDGVGSVSGVALLDRVHFLLEALDKNDQETSKSEQYEVNRAIQPAIAYLQDVQSHLVGLVPLEKVVILQLLSFLKMEDKNRGGDEYLQEDISNLLLFCSTCGLGRPALARIVAVQIDELLDQSEQASASKNHADYAYDQESLRRMRVIQGNLTGLL